MAKIGEAAGTVKERLRAHQKAEVRYNDLNGHRRASAKAMRRAALRYYPEERLRALHRAITEDVAGNVLAGLVRKLQRDVIASPRFSGFAPPAKVNDNIFGMDGFRGMADVARADMARHQTHVHELYGLAVLLSTEDPDQADAFGDCDDPDAALREMKDWEARQPAVRESLRTAQGDDVVFLEERLVDGRRVMTPYYAIAPDVRLGDVDALIAWARQHRAELGV